MSAIILDIEGTVCPIAFVHEVLFPYALQRAKTEIPLLKFPLQPERSDLELHLTQFPPEYSANSKCLLEHIEDLTKRDVKASYLKALQGYLWKSGYELGEITAPLFIDAVEAIKRWSPQKEIYIYSSGSVPAQKLLFSHTNAGDLTSYISGYFDTQNAGPKTEATSYKKIAESIKHHSITFFSDNPSEIDAATENGWKTVFVVRPGNPHYDDYKHPDLRVENFNSL